MLRKKKTVLVISFALGALLIATTAFADITNKSGYDQLKESIKDTVEMCSTQLDSFTFESSMVFKDNGKVLSSENSVSKYDRINKVTESISSNQRLDGRSYSSYSYSDKTTDIRKYSDSEEYYETRYIEEKDPIYIDNPFAEDEFKDVERVIDALVGSLRDHVHIEELADGSKEIYGSLNEAQIPALINALTSLQMKQEVAYRDNQDFRLTQDIYVKGVGGSAQVNPDGLLESILGTVTISGKDDKGNTHELTLDILFRVYDVNNTEISKPDLTGKKVVKEEGISREKPSSEILTNPDKYIGSYKNDIIIEKNGRFEKIGERKLEITKLDNSQVAGKYTEEYKDDYQEYAANKLEFSFVGNFAEGNYHSATLEITDNSGGTQQGNIYIDEYRAKIDLYLDRVHRSLEYDPTFTPDLD